MSLIEVKLRPTGPWRAGDRAGDRERVDVVYHSDALFSAVTHAMRALGWLEEWLDATARSADAPAVRFSSLFPFIGKTRLVPPPKSVWPPTAASKLYLQGAKLVPLEIVKSGVVEESRWQVDGESGCIVPLGGAAPFRVSMRSAAAVDRITGAADPHRMACLEFAPNAGWWGVFEVSDGSWEARVKAALRLLADSGFGGERSRGWGRSSDPHFSDAAHLFSSTGAENTWWLLSLYSPHESDVADWARGEYSTSVRGGWTDSLAGAGPKKQVRMVDEGSVLAAVSLRGQAVDVAPDGFAHPVYRAGFALALPAPSEIVIRAVETTRPQRVVPVAPAAEPEMVANPVEAVAPGEDAASGRLSATTEELPLEPAVADSAGETGLGDADTGRVISPAPESSVATEIAVSATEPAVEEFIGAGLGDPASGGPSTTSEELPLDPAVADSAGETGLGDADTGRVISPAPESSVATEIAVNATEPTVEELIGAGLGDAPSGGLSTTIEELPLEPEVADSAGETGLGDADTGRVISSAPESSVATEIAVNATEPTVEELIGAGLGDAPSGGLSTTIEELPLEPEVADSAGETGLGDADTGRVISSAPESSVAAEIAVSATEPAVEELIGAGLGDAPSGRLSATTEELPLDPEVADSTGETSPGDAVPVATEIAVSAVDPPAERAPSEPAKPDEVAE